MKIIFGIKIVIYMEDTFKVKHYLTTCDLCTNRLGYGCKHYRNIEIKQGENVFCDKYQLPGFKSSIYTKRLDQI